MMRRLLRCFLLTLLPVSGPLFAAQKPCHDLRTFTLTAAAIGLPTTGAEVVSAHRSTQEGMHFCRVLGRIHPVDPEADDIRFEVNLPQPWNGKAVHFGGGTFDGYLAAANGRGHTAVELRSQPTPLAQGYATLGSDSGHHRNYFPFPDAVNSLNPKFARNREQLRNFGGDAIKKVHDVAVALMQTYYGHGPSRMYFAGGSTGGREALVAAERFGTDYDGVLAAYPAWDLIELNLEFIRTAQALYAPGGFLSFGKTRWIERKVERACDASDGLRDGIVADVEDCRVPAESLRCEDGKRHHGCLSDAQVHTLLAYTTPLRTSAAASNGVDTIPGFGVLTGADLTGSQGLLPFPQHNPKPGFNSFGYLVGDDVVRNFLSAGHHYDALRFPYETGGQWEAEIQEVARELDATNTDLSTFEAHGGKLLLVHGTRDRVIPTASTVDFYQRMERSMGSARVRGFAKLYIVPGLGHGGGRFDAGFDTIGVLDAWVERGAAPQSLVATDNHGGRTRPLCEWPLYPRYLGSGDRNRAESFACAAPAAAPVLINKAAME